FANGLFISSANIGTTLGTTFAGIIISGIGIQYMAFTGVVFAIASLVFILLRIKLNPSTV
ncbi:MAG TPA: MFS transporter, partial [Erysipelotrichaceae bacterium]|nr:MFS transporter [Erysipelotrichaceae bacterium]